MTVRIARFLLRPALALPCLQSRVIRIRSGPARGFHGFPGQWSFPGRPDKEELFLRLLNYERRTVYDIGANVGATVLFFSSRVTEPGIVVAFEPNPAARAVLQQHIELNRRENVQVFSYAIGSESTTATLSVPLRARGQGTLKSPLTPGRSVEYEVQQTPLDQFIDTHTVPIPSLIKIDTEGFEAQCLRGMDRTLARHHPTLFLEMHGYTDDEKRLNAEDIVRICAGHDYRLFHVETESVLAVDNAEIAKSGHIFATTDPAEMRSVSRHIRASFRIERTSGSR